MGKTPVLSGILRAAGLYNAAWGTWAIVFPSQFWNWMGMAEPNYPQLWQCIGMMVGVYGVAYWIAARDIERYWPIVLAGLLGKILGPAGFVIGAWRGELPWRFGVVNLTNDLIWWVPFGWMLWRAWRAHHPPQRLP